MKTIYAGLFIHYRNDSGKYSLRESIYNEVVKYYTLNLMKQNWGNVVISNITTMSSHHTPYNRAASRNVCAKTALGKMDVMVIVDADTFISPVSLIEAIKQAHTTNHIILPFKTYRKEINPSNLPQFLRNYPKGGYKGLGSCYVVKPLVWDNLGGMDETFTHWGGEDNCFVYKAWAFGVETQHLTEGVAFGVETGDHGGRKKHPSYQEYLQKQTIYETYWTQRNTPDGEKAREQLKQLILKEQTQ